MQERGQSKGGELFEGVKRVVGKAFDASRGNIGLKPSAFSGVIIGSMVATEVFGLKGFIPGLIVGGVAGEVVDRRIEDMGAQPPAQQLEIENSNLDSQ